MIGWFALGPDNLLNHVVQKNAEKIGDGVRFTTDYHRCGIAQPTHERTVESIQVAIRRGAGGLSGSQSAVIPPVHSRWRHHRVIAEVKHLYRGRPRERDRNVGVANIDPEVVTRQPFPRSPKRYCCGPWYRRNDHYAPKVRRASIRYLNQTQTNVHLTQKMSSLATALKTRVALVNEVTTRN